MLDHSLINTGSSDGTLEPRCERASSSRGLAVRPLTVRAQQNKPNCRPRPANGLAPSLLLRCALSLEFIDENGGGPGVRLKKPRHKKRT
jgi:hypothetical protein